MIEAITRLWNDESGQDLVEYALLVVLVTIAVIAALRLLGPTISGFFNDVSSNLEAV